MNRLRKGRPSVKTSISYLTICWALQSSPALAENSASWVETRSLDRTVLIERSASDAEVTEEEQIRALLTLADRAINRSTAEATTHLEQAESLLTPDSEAHIVAKALRCQLEHRQSLPSAEASCRILNETNTEPYSSFVRAFVHVTKMYYFYREGQHEQSMQEAELGLQLATPIYDPALLAAGNNMLGLHFSTRLRPRMSLPFFESALEHASHLPYTEPKTITQLNLASSYTYLGRAREALQMLQEANISQVVNLYATRRLVVQSMIGQARAAIGETEGAEADLLRVINEVSDVVLPDGMTYGYTGLGIIQLTENRPDKALASFDKVLAIIGKNFTDDLKHPRIQLIAVPYATALRESGRIDDARMLLQSVISAVPPDEPDQILLDAYRELTLTLQMAGDEFGAKVAIENATNIESRLWDASLQYQVARLNSSVQSDRQKYELERAREREASLLAEANRESRLRRQSWLIGIMAVLVVVLFYSRRLQKRIADTQRAASANLEHQVRERTKELEDEMSKRMAAEIEQRQMAEKVFEGEKLRAMGQLTAGVAHDFNNLMTVVTLGADDLKSRVRDQKDIDAEHTLEQIHSAADTGAKITRGLLAYVREQPLQPQRVQLNEFLRDSLPMFRNTLGERITLVFTAETCRVIVDKGQLTTALLNLLLNAKEAMTNGGHVSLDLRNIDNQAQIEVRDSGSGMDTSVLKHAVEPFFTTKDNEEGSGLGLSMVFGFARQSNGDLQINSKPGEGTTVVLSLPLAENTPATRIEGKDAPGHIPEGINILAVEDRPQILNVLARSLVKLGANVTTAPNADEAYELTRKSGLPDLLVTDIVMPGEIDGLGLVAKLRKIEPNLPVVLMSGYTRAVDDECTFLHKPFSSSELVYAIEQALSEQALSQDTV